MKTLLLGLVLAAGCIVGDSSTGTGGEGGGGTGGGGTGGGGGGGTADTLVDAGAGGGSGVACTNAVYDPCNDNAQCASNRCQLFNSSALQVCTTTCTPGDNTTCPMQNGQPATCNNMGICKPLAANACTR